MIFTAENILLIGAILIFCSILISKTGYRFGIPTLLLFLLVGMGFGSDGLGLQFDSAIDAQFIGMIALSIILFTGGMDTKLTDIRPVLAQGILLSTVGVLLTTLLTGGFIYYLSQWTDTNISMSFLTCLLLAATMSSTDSASVFNLLRSQKMNLKENLRPMLELESGSNDPMAYMLTIALIQVVASGSDLNLGLIGKDLLVQFLFGGVIGFTFGKFAVWLINKINLSNGSLYPILLLSLVFITFTTTDLLKGNGYLAVYIAGVVVNGALTIGTMDGANVEMYEEVGADNIFIFGMSADEVQQKNIDGYDPWMVYNMNQEVRMALTSLIDGTFDPNTDMFRELYDALLSGFGGSRADEYYVLEDYADYARAHWDIDAAYRDQERWARMAIMNTAKSGKFSSDRTIRQYADEIWNLPTVDIEL